MLLFDPDFYPQLGFMVFIPIGFIGGVFSGIIGLGGGVIITPMMIYCGFHPLLAFPTQLIHSVITNFVGYLEYKEKLSVDYKLSMVVIVGAIIGIIIKFVLYNYFEMGIAILENLHYDYIFILFASGMALLIQSIRLLRSPHQSKIDLYMKDWMIFLPFHYIFNRSRVELSILIPLTLGVMMGLFVTVLGGGLSLFMMPALTYLLGRPSKVVIGTGKFTVFVISTMASVVISYNHLVPDFMVVVFLLIGSISGMRVGRLFKHQISKNILLLLSSIFLLGMAVLFFMSVIHHSDYFAPSPRFKLSAYILLEESLIVVGKLHKEILKLIIDYPMHYSAIVCMFFATSTFLFVYFKDKILKKI